MLLKTALAFELYLQTPDKIYWIFDLHMTHEESTVSTSVRADATFSFVASAPVTLLCGFIDTLPKLLMVG